MNKQILLVDDDKSVFLILSKFLSKLGYDVYVSSNIETAKKILRAHKIDILISDIIMSNNDDGIDLLNYTKKYYPHIKVILMTGFTTVELTLKAIKNQVDSFLQKPISFNELEKEIKRLEKSSKITSIKLKQEKNSSSKAKYIKKVGMVMSSNSPLVELIDFIELIANKKVSVFIYGESGTGKELIAKALFNLSKCNKSSFVPINCGAIPKELIESELFGHAKGSFTGAISDKIGRIEMAHKGVLFLDEIGELSLDMQVKFLRILQEKMIRPIGGKYSKEIDFRLVCATNVDLEEAIKKKQFREDLFYRINVIPINLPPLRKRKEDIPALISYFIEQSNKEYETNIKGITDEALNYFINYKWPGNIRELQNMIERLTIIKDEGYIDVCDLPEKITNGVNPKLDKNYKNFICSYDNEEFDFKKMVESYQTEIILYSLNKFNGNKKKAAEFLKLKRTTFVEMVKRLNIEHDKS